MAIGGVWKGGGDAHQPGQAYASATGPAAGVTPVSVVDPVPFVETRTVQLLSKVQSVPTGTPGVSVDSAVATLPAPPAGHVYRIERYTLVTAGGAAPGVTVSLAKPGPTGHVVDGVFPVAAAIITADDANGIYVPAGTTLHFCWIASTDDQVANVQYRIEEA